MLGESEMNGQINHVMQDDLMRLSAEKDGKARDYPLPSDFAKCLGPLVF